MHGQSTNSLIAFLRKQSQENGFENKNSINPDQDYEHDKILLPLATAMSQRIGSFSLNKSIPAGYTYLGQFVDHDLVLTEQESQNEDLPAIPNCVRGFTNNLDLSSVYGKAQLGKNEITNDGFLHYRIMDDNTTKNKLTSDSLREDLDLDISLWDIPRYQDGKKGIPDSRNDENWLVSRIHCLFIRLHNHIHFKYTTDKNEASFQKTRKTCITIYNKILINDYLQKILHPSVYKLWFTDLYQHKHNFFESVDNTKLLDLFSFAAFRFGHSMVRKDYFLDTRSSHPKTFPLSCLFKLVRNSDDSDRQRYLNRVEWTLFFKLNHTDTNFFQNANNISPSVKISIPNQKEHFDNLIYRNLLRGKINNLPTYRKLRDQFFTEFKTSGLDNIPEFTSLKELIKEMEPDRYLDPSKISILDSSVIGDEAFRQSLIKNEPLLYGFLCEAYELQKKTAHKSNSRPFNGPLSSIIIAQVFRQAAPNDVLDSSILESNIDLQKINSMPKLIHFLTQ